MATRYTYTMGPLAARGSLVQRVVVTNARGQWRMPKSLRRLLSAEAIGRTLSRGGKLATSCVRIAGRTMTFVGLGADLNALPQRRRRILVTWAE